MGRFWEWNHGHQDGNMLVHMNISDDGGAHSRSIHYTIFHDGAGRANCYPATRRGPGTRGQSDGIRGTGPAGPQRGAARPPGPVTVLSGQG